MIYQWYYSGGKIYLIHPPEWCWRRGKSMLLFVLAKPSVIEIIKNNIGGDYSLDTPGTTGKTFVFKILLVKVPQENEIIWAAVTLWNSHNFTSRYNIVRHNKLSSKNEKSHTVIFMRLPTDTICCFKQNKSICVQYFNKVFCIMALCEYFRQIRGRWF